MSGCGMSERPETIADIIAEMHRVEVCADGEPCLRDYARRFETARKREITILRDALAEVVASIEVRFPAIEYAIDRKPYLDAKKILEQYKEGN